MPLEAPAVAEQASSEAPAAEVPAAEAPPNAVAPLAAPAFPDNPDVPPTPGPPEAAVGALPEAPASSGLMGPEASLEQPSQQRLEAMSEPPMNPCMALARRVERSVPQCLVIDTFLGRSAQPVARELCHDVRGTTRIQLSRHFQALISRTTRPCVADLIVRSDENVYFTDPDSGFHLAPRN